MPPQLILKSTKLDTRTKIGARTIIMGIGAGTRTCYKKSPTASRIDIQRVSFMEGEEKEAIKLFVDTNLNVLVQLSDFIDKNSFYPASLYPYFRAYFNALRKLESVQFN